MELTLQDLVIIKQALNMLNYPASLVGVAAPLLEKINKGYEDSLKKTTAKEKQNLLIPQAPQPTQPGMPAHS